MHFPTAVNFRHDISFVTLRLLFNTEWEFIVTIVCESAHACSCKIRDTIKGGYLYIRLHVYSFETF